MDKKRAFSGGMGTGFVTLITIFSVICLAVLAVMSYQAASANDVLNEKSIAYTKAYYEADSRAKEKLMLLDKAAYEAVEGFFESDFAEYCAEIDGVKLSKKMEGFTAEYSEPINDRLSIRVSVLFYSMPTVNRYIIKEYKTVSADSAEEEKPLGVWDGTAFE